MQLISINGIVYKVIERNNEKWVEVNEITSTDECVTIPSKIDYKGETLKVYSINIAVDETGEGKDIEVKCYHSCGYVLHRTYVPCYKKNLTLRRLILTGHIELVTIMKAAFPSLRTIEVDMDFVKAKAEYQLKKGLEFYHWDLVIPCPAKQILSGFCYRIMLMYHRALDKSDHASIRCKVPQLSSADMITGDLIPVTIYYSGEIEYVNKNEIAKMEVLKDDICDISFDGCFFFNLIFSGVQLTMKDGKTIHVVEDLDTIKSYIV